MTFEDLKFKEHPDYPNNIQAKTFFNNGFGARVEGGSEFAGDGIDTFEVTVLQGTEEDADPCLYNPLCPVSIEHATKEVVEDTINDIATFEPYETHTRTDR
jgi:hypothetical protein